MKFKISIENGITLVSLVITIVIILILTGVSVSFFINDNGIIKKAKDASNLWGISGIHEQIKSNLLAEQIDENTNALVKDEFEKSLLLDVARRYYTVDEIKQYIDIVSEKHNASFQMHFSDDQNVGIECNYLNQTKENATVNENVYTNLETGKKFLTYEQVRELMDYCKGKNIVFIPTIDVPAHMNGFFDLARIKFGDNYVNNIARGTGSEIGNIDIVQPESKEFIKSLYDEYTEFFKDCKYFNVGFDEYTYRVDEKIDFLNSLYDYMNKKGFTVCMWNDSITQSNYNLINKNINIFYWNYGGDGYATVKELQNADFKVLITNNYYLFYVPSVSNSNESDLNYMVNDIEENWTLDAWDETNIRNLDNYNNINGGLICVWGEDSSGVNNSIILKQTRNMYNAMSKKLDECKNK